MSKDSIQQRMADWMADYEDPSGAFREVPDRDALLDTAFHIMVDSYLKFVTPVFIEEFCRLNPTLISEVKIAPTGRGVKK